MEPLAKIRELTRTYGRTLAVNNMNLDIPHGKIIGLLGPNGSGKTTLIKMMNGLLTPTAGTIRIEGDEPGTATKKKVAYLPERTYLQNGMKVNDLVDFFSDFYEDFDRERAFTMLQSLDISFSAQLKTLSKGTKEKVQLILVMSRHADLFILDEPIAGVDPAARDYILRTIISNYDDNASILLSTHLITDIENILDEVIFIREGQILSHMSVDQIREEHGKSVDAYFREVFAC